MRAIILAQNASSLLFSRSEQIFTTLFTRKLFHPFFFSLEYIILWRSVKKIHQTRYIFCFFLRVCAKVPSGWNAGGGRRKGDELPIFHANLKCGFFWIAFELCKRVGLKFLFGAIYMSSQRGALVDYAKTIRREKVLHVVQNDTIIKCA